MRIALFLALVAGCAVDLPTEATTSADLCVGGYCADVTFYCPPNPLLECQVWCLQTCYSCDDGDQFCIDNPLPE
jgi:hypothetical protein